MLFNHVSALLVLMQRCKSIDFHQNRPKIKLFLQKYTELSSASCSAPKPTKQPLHCRFLATCLSGNNAL